MIGCLGGLGVNIYRLYEASHQPKETRPPYDTVYMVQLIGLSLLGGAVALINDLTKPISPLTAFNVGLSLPALLKAGADSRVKSTRKRKSDSSARIN